MRLPFSKEHVMSFQIGQAESEEDFTRSYARFTCRVNLAKVVLYLLGSGAAAFILILFIAAIENGSHHPQPPPPLKDLQEAFRMEKETDFSNNSLNNAMDKQFVRRPKQSNKEKQDFIRRMFLEAWTAYRKHAWGADNLRPLDKRADNRGFGGHGGLTLVKSMSTLWVMDIKDEFARAFEWVTNVFDFANSDNHAYVFVAATEYMGSMLSCYALTKKQIFLDQARNIGKSLLPAFNTPTGFPRKSINPTTGKHGWDSSAHLAEVGGIQLEFKYLDYLGPNMDIYQKLDRIQKRLESMSKPQGLYLSDVDTDRIGKWSSSKSTLFWNANTFYQYLVKLYVQMKDTAALDMYKAAMDAVEKVGIITTTSDGPGAHTYAQTYDTETKRFDNVMKYDGCALGGMLALGALQLERELRENTELTCTQRRMELARIERHWSLAENITEACHSHANRTKTGLPPALFYFKPPSPRFLDPESRVTDRQVNTSGGYPLTPDLVESYFYLWRLTHEEKYRTYAWEFVMAIHEHARVGKGTGGYTSLMDVNDTHHENHQSSHLLASTFKYLYLIFSDDDLLPLDEWVFNRVGQPLPISGKNPAFM